MRRVAFATLGLFLLSSQPAAALGVSPYLPLNLNPEIEREIERVLILGDKPVLTRPIAAATVLDALPQACKIDVALCQRVRRFLDRYMNPAAITHLSVESSISSGAQAALPNRYGLTTESDWQVSATGHWQPGDHALLSLGGIAYKGGFVPQGSILSLGFDRAQLDIGYRSHWFSPLTDSSMLLSTEAATMPSVTLSNYAPLTRFGLHYEAFLARMSESDTILFQGERTSGHPRLAGFHLSMEPASGWAIGVNRLMQYGGGPRGGNSLRDLLDAFFQPSQFDNVDVASASQFGNQTASFTSRFLFTGKTPFAVYFEYAGEDTSHGNNYLLGNAALSVGIHLPRLWRTLDLTYEASEWQNTWYTNAVYGDGLTNDGHVIGHWAGDDRKFGDGVGGQSHMLRVGWEPRFGGLMQLRLRTLANESYSQVAYERAYDAMLSYSRDWRQFAIGGEVSAGRNVFGGSFSWAGAFIRYPADAFSSSSLDYVASTTADSMGVVFVDAGINANKVLIDLSAALERTRTATSLAPHFAVGARRAVSNRSDLGVRLELDNIDGHALVGVRLLDYRYRFSGPLALSAFAGAARYDLATPAYGQYLGIGGQWRDVVDGWDLALDLRKAINVARDHLLPGDPPNVGSRADSFYDVASATVYLSRRF